MQVEYKTQAGSTIILEVVETRLFRRKPIYSERGNYLYTQHDYEFDCIFNQSSNLPFAPTAMYAGTTDNEPGREPSAVGVRSDNIGVFTPVRTDVALRHHLSQPRKELLIRDFNNSNRASIDLQSPGADQTCDVKNGPIPKVLEVTRISEKTWFVRWAVTTWVNETRFVDESENVSSARLLEHEWRMSHTIDDRHFTTRTIYGRLLFNINDLEENNLAPDDFRQWAFPVPPDGFKRMSVDVQALEDGSGINYVVVDRELRCQLKERGVTKVECVHNAGITVPSLVDRAFNGANLSISVGGDFIGNVVGLNLTGAARSLANMPSQGAAFVRSNLPISTVRVQVRVYGAPDTPFATLQAVAYRILTARFGSLTTAASTYNVSVNETHFVHEGVVDLQATRISGIGEQAVQSNLVGFAENVLQGLSGNIAGAVAAGIQATFTPSMTNLVPPNDNIETVGTFDSAPAVSGSSTLPLSNGSRATPIEIVISQAIRDAANKPQRISDRLRNRLAPDDPHA